MPAIVSGVASATPRVPASAAALANWFLRSSWAARLAALWDLLLPEGGLILARALSARTSNCPLFHRSRREVISALTAEDDAPGFWGPSTSVGNRNKASHAASRKVSPRVSAALLKRSVATGSRAARLGFGIATADRQPDSLMCKGVKLGCWLQNSTAAEWGGTLCGADLAALAWAANDACTPAIVVARYGPFSSAEGAKGLLSWHLRLAMWNSKGLEMQFSPPLK